MADWGLLPTGFVRKTLAQVKQGTEDRLRQGISRAVKTVFQSGFGQIIAVTSGVASELWEVLEEIVASGDRAGALGVALDAIGALTGTIRKAATYSVGQLLLTGDPSTAVESGSRVQNVAGDLVVLTIGADATLATATAWAAATSYALGDIRRSGGKIYYCAIGGTSGSTGPTTTPAAPLTVVDGTVEWWYIGDGNAYAVVDAQAQDLGAVTISTLQLTAIGSPTTGWRGVANIEDFETGSDVESDDDYRIRQVLELKGLARATVESIQAAVSSLRLVTEVTVFENPFDVTDDDGIPPHAVEVLVSGTAAAADIAAAIFRTKAAGIQTYGSVTTLVNDSRGGSHEIKHSVPSDVPLYAKATLYIDRNRWNADLETKAKAAVVAFGQGLRPGYNANPGAFVSAVFKAVASEALLDVIVQLDTAPITESTPVVPVPMSLRQRARTDSARTSTATVLQAP